MSPPTINIPGYKIIKTIGSGGMATVYLATQQSIERLVAIKVMSPALAADPSFSDRFVKEARMANLSHPNIVTIYDAGALENTNYIVMEYASGGNLDGLIKQGISISRSLTVIKQIASALHYSCEQGIIHRDVKPENIIFRSNQSAVLMDFGIAKAVSSGTQLTMIGSTIGSPNYMSPEQARGLALDGRSDLYSLGVVFFESLTGTKPFDAADTYVIGLKHINDPIPKLPGNLEQYQPIIDRLLAKVPESRFDNGEQLIEALAAYDLGQDDLTHQIPVSAVETKNPKAPISHSHDDKTYNVNTIVSDVTNVIPENSSTPTDSSREQSKQPTAIENNLTSDSTKIISDEPLVIDEPINDKTQILPEADLTQIMPSPSDDKTVILKRASHQPSQQKKSQSGLYMGLFLLIAIGGGGVFWYVSKSQNIDTTPAEIADKKPIELSPQKDISEVPKEVNPVKIPSKDITQTTPKPTITTDKITDFDPEIEIELLLKKARHSMAKKRFTSPKNDNAYNYFSEILAINNTNKEAINGLNKIADRYFTLASKRYDAQQLKKALSYIDRGLTVIPDHKKLLALKGKIKPSYKTLTPKKNETNKLNIFQSLLLKDLSIEKNSASHISKHVEESQWFARQDFINNLYNRILRQCNASDNFFNRPECITNYNNYLRHWPLPLKGISLKLNKVSGKQIAKYSFNADNFRQSYKRRLKTLYNTLSDSKLSTKNKIIARYNYVNYQSLVSIIGIKTKKVDPSEINTYLSKRIKSNSIINSKTDLIDFINYLEKYKTIHLAPITSSNSLEVTDFSLALYQALPENLKHSAITAEHQLFLNYSLKPNGDTSLTLWLFDKENELIDLNRVLLKSDLLDNKTKANQMFNIDIQPQQRLKASYGFPVSIAMDKSTNNPTLIVGKSTSLNVKLNSPGFYFIAVHVIHGKDQYSYLLPLHDADIPFVRVSSSENTNQFIEVGKFTITPPTGVEVLQLIASSVNLEKYLPAYHWDEEKNQFIIDGSEGNIKKGIGEVRNYMNTLPKVSHDKNVRWQERLLVTSILK